MAPSETSQNSLEAEIRELSQQLSEAQETLRAIRQGEVDALVVSTPEGMKTYTLSGAEKPYRLLIEQMHEGAVMLSSDDAILYCNKGFSDFVQFPLDTLVNRKIDDFVAPTHLELFRDLLASSHANLNVASREITFTTKEGKIKPSIVSANCTKNDTILTTFLVITDLTVHMAEEVKRYTANLEQEIFARKKAQEALKESEQRWATTLASIGDAVIATDLTSRITFMNGVAEELTGWTLPEAANNPVKEIFHIVNEQTGVEVENPIHRVLKEGLIVGLANHTVLLRKNGTEVPIDDSGAPIKDKDGKMTGVVLIFRDITERKKAEKELQERTEKLELTQQKLEENAIQLEEYSNQMEALASQRLKKLQDAERLAAIGQVAGMVGHDIRNPLQAIVGELYFAKESIKETAKEGTKGTLESLDFIQEQTDYISKIVTDLQDYSKPLKPDFSAIELSNFLRDAEKTISLPDNIKTQFICEGEIPTVILDKTFTTRILTNLFTNAIQAMPKGGKLTVKASKQNKSAVISVEDTGVGIPEEVKGKMFTPLFTTKSKGQGFGLAVVKRLVEAQGGTISFESELGKGTKFIVEFPLNR